MCSITGRFSTGTIGFGIVVGDRPQARAQAGREDHRPHPISSLKRSIASTGSGSTPRCRGQLQRDEVAQHHRPEQPRDPRSRPRSRPAPPRRRRRAIALGGQLEAAALARVLVAVLEEDARRALASAAPGPAADLVVVGLGQLARRRRAAWRSR